MGLGAYYSCYFFRVMNNVMNITRTKFGSTRILSFLSVFTFAFLPLLAHAQTIQAILIAFTRVVAVIIPVAFALILLAFFWGVAKFVLSVGEEGKTEGKTILLWGVIALFVASSVWGIAAYMRTLLGVGGNYDRKGLDNVVVPEYGSTYVPSFF